MNPKPENRDYECAVDLVHSICCLAGVPSYLNDLRADLRDNGVLVAVNDHDTAVDQGVKSKCRSLTSWRSR
jgi:hypothetical protein